MGLMQWLRIGSRVESRLGKADGLVEAGRLADAARVLQDLALRGVAEAQWRLARCYQHGEGVVPDFAQAVVLLRAAAQAGHLPAQAHLGEVLLRGIDKAPATTTASVARLEQLRGGNSLLGQLFAEGFLVPQNADEAALWNERAARAGDTGAQARYGYQLLMGFGVPRDREAARGWLEASAAGAHEGGQFGLGLYHSAPDSPEPDSALALVWFERAAAQGNASACLCAGQILLAGDGSSARNPGRGQALLEEAARQGLTEAMYRLGEMHLKGTVGMADPMLAESWLQRAAERGHMAALLMLVRLLASDPEPQLEAATAWCRRAADADVGEAQFLMGQFHLAGEGVLHDPKEAQRWFVRATKNGVMDAHERLGFIHATGLTGKIDHPAARTEFERAAQADHTGAMVQLGDMHRHGLGGAVNAGAATRWYEQAAARGSAEACLKLGTLHAEGLIVAQDHGAAARWYASGAERGSPEATFNLAHLYLQGKGVARSADRGRALLSEAAAAGVSIAAEQLAGLLESPGNRQQSHLAPVPSVPSVALCAIMKNEGRAVLEWVAHHAVLGFDRIAIYDNGSTGESADLLRQLGEQKVIEYVQWPDMAGEAPQRRAYNHFLQSAREDWVCFLDADEFLNLKVDDSIHAFVQRVPEDVAAVGINWRIFGSSGHEQPPPGLVTESYLRCSEVAFDANRHIKTLARRMQLTEMVVHAGIVRGGRYIDEAGRSIGVPVDGSPGALTAINDGLIDAVSSSTCQVNHYLLKSRQCYEQKRRRGDADRASDAADKFEKLAGDGFWSFHDRNECVDLTILRWLPQLRSKLEWMNRQLTTEHRPG